MQILEDNIEDYGDMPKRIQALRKKVKELLENAQSKTATVVSSEKTDELVREIAMLKTQLADREKTILKNETTKVVAQANDGANKKLEEEIESLKAQLVAKEEAIEEIKATKVSAPISVESDDDLVQENIFLKKQLANREKTIKELDFKLEMFKLAKTLREGSGIGSKSEELKQMITEYIKEIDKSITSLNIE